MKKRLVDALAALAVHLLIESCFSLRISSTDKYRSRWSSGRFTSTSSAGFRSMPVSLDQIVAAFSIMWCMTLKCRTAVPADKPFASVRPSYQRRQAVAVNLPNKQSPKLGPDALQHAFLPVAETLLAAVMRPSTDQSAPTFGN